MSPKTCPWCHNPTPCHRCQNILQLLELLPDSETTLNRGPSHGEGLPPQMPPLYHHPSFIELRRCLAALLKHDRQAWAHTLAYYGAEWRTTREQIPSRDRQGHIRRNRQGIPLTELGPPTRKRIIHPWIGTQAKDRGVAYIINTYAIEPTIPDEITLTEHELHTKRERRQTA